PAPSGRAEQKSRLALVARPCVASTGEHVQKGGRSTGLEPATFGTTIQRSNQLSYDRQRFMKCISLPHFSHFGILSVCLTTVWELCRELIGEGWQRAGRREAWWGSSEPWSGRRCRGIIAFWRLGSRWGMWWYFWIPSIGCSRIFLSFGK